MSMVRYKLPAPPRPEQKPLRFSSLGAQKPILQWLAADGAYFNGQLDDVRIYNQVLTANEISGLAIVPGPPTLTSATAESGPVVHLTWTVPSSYAEYRDRSQNWHAGIYAAIATVGGGVFL